MVVEVYAFMCSSKAKFANGVQLHKSVEPEQVRMCWFEDQRQVLCLSSEVANYNFFCLIFFTRIIEVIFRSKYESLVKDMRNLRNEECHRSNKEVPNTDFVNLWKCTADMLEKCSLDFSLVDDLKDCDPRIMSSAFEVDGFLLFRII